MARTDLPAIRVTQAGVAPSSVAGTVDGHKFLNHGDTMLVVKNTGVGAHVVTVQTPAVEQGLAVADQTNSIAAGATEYMGPFPPELFNQGGVDANKVFIDYDATPAELSITALKFVNL